MLTIISKLNNTPRFGLNTTKPDSRPTLRLKGQPSKDSVSFQGHFRFMNLPEVPCAYCGSPMISAKKINLFAQFLENKRGQQLQESLKSLLKGQHNSTEKAVARLLVRKSQKFPDKNVPELLQEMLPNALARLHSKERKIFEEAKKITAELPQETKAKTDEYFHIVNSAINDNIFRRKIALAGFWEIYESEKNPKNRQVLEKAFDTLSTLPSSGHSTDAFIVKYHNRPAQQIGERLLDPYASTREHIHPQSEGGVSNETNYLGTHKNCNNKRQATSLDKFVEMNPAVIGFIVENLRAVEKHIQKGETYLQDVSRTLFEESKGKIRLPWLKDTDPTPKKAHINSGHR